jgi:hypothetical protein
MSAFDSMRTFNGCSPGLAISLQQRHPLALSFCSTFSPCLDSPDGRRDHYGAALKLFGVTAKTIADLGKRKIIE